MANKPQVVTYDSTGTGASTGYASFPTGVSQAYVSVDNPTTSVVQVAKLQASVGGSGNWFDISAGQTLSTTVTTWPSTVTAVFDRVRINVTTPTTNTGTHSAYIIAK